METMSKITVITIVLALSVFATPAAILLAEGEAVPTTDLTQQPVAEVPASEGTAPVTGPAPVGEVLPPTQPSDEPLSPVQTDLDNLLNELTSRGLTAVQDPDNPNITYYKDAEKKVIATVIEDPDTSMTTVTFADGSPSRVFEAGTEVTGTTPAHIQNFSDHLAYLRSQFPEPVYTTTASGITTDILFYAPENTTRLFPDVAVLFRIIQEAVWDRDPTSGEPVRVVRSVAIPERIVINEAGITRTYYYDRDGLLVGVNPPLF